MKATKNLLVVIAILLSSTQVYSQFCLCPANYAPCNGALFTENYSSSFSWLQAFFSCNPGASQMSLAGGVMNYNNVRGGCCNRMLRTVPGLAATGGEFRAECVITVNNGNSPAHYIMAFTQTGSDPISSCTTPYTPNTINSGVYVLLGTPNAPGAGGTNPCNPANPWQFMLRFKNGGTLSPQIASIPYPCNGIMTFYIRLIVSKNNACLYIYSDPNFTNQIPGSPTYIQNMPPPVTANLGFIQHGVVSYGSNTRVLNMTLDNLRICNYGGDCNTSLRIQANSNDPMIKDKSKSFSILPNPNNGIFRIESIDNIESIQQIIVRDLSGKEVFASESNLQNSSYEVQLSNSSKGLYIIEIYTESNKYIEKISIE